MFSKLHFFFIFFFFLHKQFEATAFKLVRYDALLHLFHFALLPFDQKFFSVAVINIFKRGGKFDAFIERQQIFGFGTCEQGDFV